MEKDEDEKRGLSASERTGVVQHAYVNCRLREINSAANKDQLRLQTLNELRKDLQFGAHAPSDRQLLKTYERMTARLQAARLTINFKADKWFATENKYDSYTQMYERAMRDPTKPDSVVLTANADNPAYERVKADESVTFPSAWRAEVATPSTSAGAWSKPSQRGELKKVSGPRAETLDAFRQRALMGKASFGAPIDVSSPGTGERSALMPGNVQFDPRTKQVFAALDYGERPHGAAIGYGYSFLVLNKRFKTNALYFAGDTFFAAVGATTAEHQVSFDLLGALYYHAKQNPCTAQSLPLALQASCITGLKLTDVPQEKVDAMALLVEAHLFEPLNFAGGVETIYLSRKSTEGMFWPKEWATLTANCRKFAKRNGCKVVFLDEGYI